jgi:peptidoglycan-associated lipoprotein
MDNAGATGRNIPGGAGVPSSNFSPESIAKEGGIAQAGPGAHENWNANPEVLQEYTVHFDFDSSVVKGVDQGKVKAVADYLRANASNAVRVEGHCDERGTEEYNRALGERRAVAIREELVKMGIEPTRVDTISYGKDRPIDFGQNEEAWRKNRRGEFILLTPPTAAP